MIPGSVLGLVRPGGNCAAEGGRGGTVLVPMSTSLKTSGRGIVIGRHYAGGGDRPQPPPPRRGV